MESALVLVDPVLTNPPDPWTFHGVHPWFPTCVAVSGGSALGALCVSVGVCAPAEVAAAAAAPETAYVAWNVTSGLVYVESWAFGAQSFVLPAALLADCEYCPAPTSA